MNWFNLIKQFQELIKLFILILLEFELVSIIFFHFF
jgi:hypothetical protein